MTKKNVLFLNGIEDNRNVKISKISKNGNIQWQSRGSTNLNNFLKNNYFTCSKLILDTTSNQELPQQIIHGVFNEIADADSHKITLQKAEDFYQAVSSHVPFLNIPSSVMKTTRDNIFKLLQDIDKLHVPKTVKIQPKSPQEIYETIQKEGFELPVIFRQAGDHDGISTIRVNDKSEGFYAFALDGRNYYLTQYVEYVEKDGLYKKYRLLVVDGKVYLRHVKVSMDWMVYHKTQIENPEKVQQRSARRFFDHEKAIQKVVNQIHHRLQLDYFGIDCYIDNKMNLLIFEINPSMGVFTKEKNDIFSKNVDEIRKAVIKMIESRINK